MKMPGPNKIIQLQLPVLLKYLLFLTLGLFLWLAGIFLTPLMASAGISWMQQLGRWGYFFFSPVCHQIPSRSFMLSGLPLAVCVRCLSVYLAGFILCLAMIRQYRIRLLSLPVYLFLVLPTLSDFVLEKLIKYPDLPWLRFATGFLLGLALFHLVIVSLTSPDMEKDTLYQADFSADHSGKIPL